MPGDALPLARITPARGRPPATGPGLTPREKAAIIVRYLIATGGAPPLNQLPEHVQSSLTEQMGRMRLVDRDTLDTVLGEFAAQLESVGLAFSGGLEGALQAMDGHISASTASRLRRKAGMGAKGDPWDRLVTLPADRLLPVLDAESVEVAAVILSKLPVARAADVLGQLPGERARRIAFAISRTGDVDPDTVRRIGTAVLAQIDSQPPRAFDRGPSERVGAILNLSPGATRDALLQGLEAEDTGFAEAVRRAIFTYAHIPDRVLPRDLVKVIRLVDQAALVNAMAFSIGRDGLEAATEFILQNLSQRMAQGLREDIEARGKVKEKDAETAMGIIIGVIRQLEAAGELVMRQPEEE